MTTPQHSGPSNLWTDEAIRHRFHPIDASRLVKFLVRETKVADVNLVTMARGLQRLATAALYASGASVLADPDDNEAYGSDAAGRAWPNISIENMSTRLVTTEWPTDNGAALYTTLERLAHGDNEEVYEISLFDVPRLDGQGSDAIHTERVQRSIDIGSNLLAYLQDVVTDPGGNPNISERGIFHDMDPGTAGDAIIGGIWEHLQETDGDHQDWLRLNKLRLIVDAPTPWSQPSLYYGTHHMDDLLTRYRSSILTKSLSRIPALVQAHVTDKTIELLPVRLYVNLDPVSRMRQTSAWQNALQSQI